MTVWGRSIVAKDMGGYRLQVFEPRPHNLPAILDAGARWGDREFLVFGAGRLSFSAFRAAVTRAEVTLVAAGVGRGDMVMLLGANSAEWLAVFWALARRRAVIALGNAWWSAEETHDAFRLTQPSTVIADAARRRHLPEDAVTLSLEAFETCWDVDAPTAAEPDAPDVDEEAPALLIFTSGTTSRAKAAVLSHRAAIASLHVLYAGRDKTPNEMTGAEEQQTFLSCAPLFHVSGYMSHTQALLSGHRLVMVEGRSDPAHILDLIEKEGVTMWATVPTLLSRVINHPDAVRRDLRSVQAIAAGGSPVTPELMDAMRRVFVNARMGAVATYGLTEAGGSVTAVGGEDYLLRPGSCGRALPACELGIAEPGEDGVGEILVRTPSAMSRYWGDEATAIVDGEGWIHTGDLGRIDSGYLTITGRSKDMVIRGGENISAPRVEACIARHPAVLEVAVIGLPHADLGEEVAAVVVLKEGEPVNATALQAFVAGPLAYFEIPSRWWLRHEPLPTNATSKVVKSRLVAAWRDE